MPTSKKVTIQKHDDEVKNLIDIPKTIQIFEYEPYDFGNSDQPLSYLGALLHFMKYILGTGILSIPFAFKNVGYITGLLGATLVCVLYIHIIHMLLSTEYEICKRLRVPNLTYVEVVEEAFRTSTPRAQKLSFPLVSFVYFNYVFNGITGNAAYLLIIAGNMKCVYEHYIGTEVDTTYFITAAIGPLLLLCWIPKLRFLAPFSMLTTIFCFLNIILILAIPASPDVVAKRGTPKAYNDIYFFPQFFALMLAAITGTGLTLPIKNDMEKPKYFASDGGVMNIAMLVSGVIYVFFGFASYLKFGDGTDGNVLLNLPAGNPLSLLVYSMFTIAVGISFTLNFYICFDTIWTNYQRKVVLDWKMSETNDFFLKNGLKTLICVASYLTAVGIPQFELFGALVGSFAILSEICIPPLLQILMKWSKVEGCWMVLVMLKNCCIVIAGVFLCVSGFLGSVWDIVAFYNL